jgi:hypothetical protein
MGHDFREKTKTKMKRKTLYKRGRNKDTIAAALSPV